MKLLNKIKKVTNRTASAARAARTAWVEAAPEEPRKVSDKFKSSTKRTPDWMNDEEFERYLLERGVWVDSMSED